MAYTQAQLDALKNALASGVTTISFQGRMITYRSVEELQKAITTIQNAMDASSGKRTRFYRLGSSKGL